MLKLLFSLFSSKPKVIKTPVKSLRVNVYAKNYGATPFPSNYSHM